MWCFEVLCASPTGPQIPLQSSSSKGSKTTSRYSLSDASRTLHLRKYIAILIEGHEPKVRLIEKHGLESFMLEINEKLPPKYRRRNMNQNDETWQHWQLCLDLKKHPFASRCFRTPAVKLCDEMMFAVGFAGIGGTSACCETVGAFLQCDSPQKGGRNL